MQIILNFPDDMTTEEVEKITFHLDWLKLISPEPAGDEFDPWHKMTYEIKYTRCSTCPERIQKGDEFQECGLPEGTLCRDVKP